MRLTLSARSCSSWTNATRRSAATSACWCSPRNRPDRKSTRLNSSHTVISYAVFCLKKKKTSKRVSDSSRSPPTSSCRPRSSSAGTSSSTTKARSTSDVGNRFFFFNDTAPTEIYTLSLHDALPICGADRPGRRHPALAVGPGGVPCPGGGDRKSTRLNSSHTVISYAVFCLKKKKTRNKNTKTTKRKTKNKNQQKN